MEPENDLLAEDDSSDNEVAADVGPGGDDENDKDEDEDSGSDDDDEQNKSKNKGKKNKDNDSEIIKNRLKELETVDYEFDIL